MRQRPITYNIQLTAHTHTVNHFIKEEARERDREIEGKKHKNLKCDNNKLSITSLTREAFEALFPLAASGTFRRFIVRFPIASQFACFVAFDFPQTS